MLKKDKATGKAIPYMSLLYFSVAGHTFIIDLINDFLCRFETCSPLFIIIVSSKAIRITSFSVADFTFACSKTAVSLSVSNAMVMVCPFFTFKKKAVRYSFYQQIVKSRCSTFKYAVLIYSVNRRFRFAVKPAHFSKSISRSD